MGRIMVSYSTKKKVQKKKSHRKLKVALGVVIAAAGVTGATYALNVYPGRWIRDRIHPQVEDAGYQPMTATAQVMDVQQVLSTTGTVTSNDRQVQNAHSTDGGDATGYVVDQVNVKVGDQVKAGDVLFTIDMTKTENELELNQQKLALQEQQNSIDANTAARQYNEAAITTGNSYRKQTRLNENAQEDYNNAIQEPDENAQNVADLKARMQEAQQKMNAAQKTRDDALAAYQSKQAAAQAAQNTSAEKAAQSALENSKGELTSTDSDDSSTDTSGKSDGGKSQTFAYSNQDARNQAAQAAAQAAYDATVAASAATGAESAYNNAEKALTKATEDYTKAKTAYESSMTAERAQDTQLESAADEAVSQYETGQAAADKVASQRVTNQVNTLDARQSISNAEKALENREVTASIDGTVTEVNVLPGQTYTGTAAVTIDDLSAMKVVAQIDESNIADVAEGMKVQALTDATGSDPVEGTVCYTAPVPTKDPATTKSTTTATTGTSTDSSQSSGTTTTTSSTTGTTGKGKKAYYEVDVDLGANPRLRIGMNTKLNFILKENKNCLAVPKTCIQSDGNGGYFVTRVMGDGSDLTQTEMVQVEIGAQGDMYTAIVGGDLKEGDLLIDNSSPAGGTDASAGGLMEGVAE
jgi:multidrug efflux pump subunit AcrA (membrane-fusion protein)